MIDTVTPEEEQQAFELIELADISRHPEARHIRDAIQDTTGAQREYIIFERAIVAVRGYSLDPSAKNWALRQPERRTIPLYKQTLASRLLDPQRTPPRYADWYRKLAELWPQADHQALDEAARRLETSN